MAAVWNSWTRKAKHFACEADDSVTKLEKLQASNSIKLSRQRKGCCQSFAVLLLFVLCSTLPCAESALTLSGTSPSKILIWPAEWSHWINLKILATNLVSRGHEVTVLRSSAYADFMDETDEFTFENFYVS